MIRSDGQLSVSRFAELIGVARRTYHYRLARHRGGDLAKGPWPTPVLDRIEPVVAKYAQDWPAWGHRKIRAIARVDGYDVGSASSVKRAMARRDLLQPVRYQAERRQLARARREAFAAPIERRNRVWQADFSEFETTTEGTWRFGGVADYWAKIALACPITATQTARDLIAAFDAAVATAESLIGKPLLEDCVDADTGELTPVVIVTDNGPAMKSTAVTRWFKARPELTHVRTRHRSPHTNGVIERWFESLKYERLYRHDIATGIDLADHVADFIDEFNTIRPHEALDWRRPLDAYLDDPALKPRPPNSEQES
jgi:transposase InsO family protein